MVSAVRSNRRQIAIVLGGASGKSRNAHMGDLVERGFDVMGVVPISETPALVLANHDGPRTLLRGASMRREAKPWSIQLRNMPSEPFAMSAASSLAPQSTPKLSSGFIEGAPVFHAKLAGLTAADAKAACAKVRAAQTQTKCWLIAP